MELIIIIIWNHLEVQLIAVVYKIAPLTRVVNNTVETTTPSFIKQKLNMRKRLMKSNRKPTTHAKLEKIKLLNKEIKNYYHNVRSA